MIVSAPEIKGFVRNNRALLALGFAALLAELAYAILNLSAPPVYVEFTLDQGKHLGLILGTFLLTEAISRPFFGALGDRMGRKPLMIAGPMITAVTAYLTIHFHSPWILLGLRAIDGLGSGALWPSAFAMIGDLTDEKHRSAAMSMLNVTYMSGLALGFLLGGAANRLMHTYAASFYLVTLLLVMTVVVLAFLPRKVVRHEIHYDHHEPLEMPTLEEPTEFKLNTLFSSFKLVPEMLVLACVTFLGTGFLMPIVKLYALQHLGLTEVQFGMAVAPIAAAMGLCAVPLGRLGDKYGKCVAVCWGLFGSAAAMWLLALSRSIVLAGLAGIVLGLGFIITFPAWMALVSSATASNRRGEVLGAVGMAQGLAAILGTIIGAYIYAQDVFSFPRLGIVNYNLPFWLSAILLSAATVVAFTWVCEKHGGHDQAGCVKIWQRKFVIWLTCIGILVMGAWIGYRYSRPVPPDRVAWQWVQQLVRNRPDKAGRFTTRNLDGANSIVTASKDAAVRYSCWKLKDQAMYSVKEPSALSETHAEVPVEFRFPKKKTRVETISLIKSSSGEWKVCGVCRRRL